MAQLDGAAPTRPPRPASKDATSKERRRAEVYAVNAYLKKLEQANFQKFLEEMSVGGCGLDDLSTLSWGSSQSSNMPSPTYRTAKEKQRDLAKEGGREPRAVRPSNRALPGPLSVPPIKRPVGSFGGV